MHIPTACYAQYDHAATSLTILYDKFIGTTPKSPANLFPSHVPHYPRRSDALYIQRVAGVLPHTYYCSRAYVEALPAPPEPPRGLRHPRPTLHFHVYKPTVSNTSSMHCSVHCWRQAFSREVPTVLRYVVRGRIHTSDHGPSLVPLQILHETKAEMLLLSVTFVDRQTLCLRSRLGSSSISNISILCTSHPASSERLCVSASQFRNGFRSIDDTLFALVAR